MSKHFEAFLDDLPNSALSKFQKPNGGTIWPTPAGQYNFRFDFQGYTSDGGYNLQIQANKNAKKTSVRETVPATWATVIVSKDSNPKPAELREAFSRSYYTKKSIVL